jgi:hypothetical protein
MLLRAPEIVQQRREILCLGNDVRGAQEALDGHVLDPLDAIRLAEEVTNVQNADDLIERSPIDGVAGEGRLHRRFEALLGREVDREGDHLGPWHHHVGNLLVGEVEHLVEHLPLVVLDLALLGRTLEQHLQLRLRVNDALRPWRLEPERAQRQLTRALQEPDQRLEEPEEGAHRSRHDQRRLLRVAERDPLRHELTGDDMQEGDDQEGDREGERGRHDRVQRPGQCRLAKGTDCQARAGHAELHGGDEAGRRVGQAQHEPGPAVPKPVELVHSCPAHRYERVLRRDKERIQHDQRRDGDEEQREGHAPSPGAPVLGGTSSAKS